jgi:hypothetical protein
MVKVEIIESLYSQIDKKFKHESIKIFEYLKSLELNPHKGKLLGSVGGVVIKELKYNSFRFYFITNGHKLKFMKVEELQNLLIKFVRMSEKKDQQKVIDEIKNILRKVGDGGF